MEEMAGKHELVRQDDNFVPKTLFILGQGILENAMEPIETTLKEASLLVDDYPIQPTRLGVHESLAYFGMQSRRSRSVIIKELISVLNGSSSDFEEMKQAFWMYSSICQPFRESLGKILEISKTLSLKSSLMSRLKAHGLEDLSSAVLTTCWDKGLWEYNDRALRNLIYVNGRCSSWKTLLFPSETAEENGYHMLVSKDLENRFETNEALSDKVKENCLELIADSFKPPKSESEYWHNYSVHQAYAHGRALKWLREAQRLVVCGVDLNLCSHEVYSILNDKPTIDSPEKWQELIYIGEDDLAMERLSGLLKTSHSSWTFEKCKDSMLGRLLKGDLSFFSKS